MYVSFVSNSHALSQGATASRGIGKLNALWNKMVSCSADTGTRYHLVPQPVSIHPAHRKKVLKKPLF